MTGCPRIDVDASKRDGELIISGQTFHTPAFTVLDVSPLWLGAEQRGEGMLIPGRSGRRERRRRNEESARDLPVIIDSMHDKDGDLYDDPRQGLLENLLFLRQFTDPNPYGLGYRNLLLKSPDESRTLTGRVYLSLTQGTMVGTFAKAMLTVTIPAGALTVST